MATSRSKPIVVYWDVEPRPARGLARQPRVPLGLQRIEALKADPQLPAFELRDLGAAGTEEDDRCHDGHSFLEKLREVVMDAGTRPVCVVVGTLPENDLQLFNANMLMPRQAAGGTAEELEQPVSAAAGLGTHLLIRFPEVWPIFVARQPRLEKLFIHITKQAADALIPNNTREEDGVYIAETLRKATSAAIWQCHFLGGRAPGCPIRQFLIHKDFLFDPTGLRSLVKAGLWSQVLGSDEQYGNQRCGPAAVLLMRAINNAVVADEEADFALIGAYSAYRQGRRAWAIAEGVDFIAGAWRDDVPDENYAGSLGSTLVIRDRQLRLHHAHLHRRTYTAAPGSPLVDLEKFEHWDISKWNAPAGMYSLRGADSPPPTDFAAWRDRKRVRQLIISSEGEQSRSAPSGSSFVAKPLCSILFVSQAAPHSTPVELPVDREGTVPSPGRTDLRTVVERIVEEKEGRHAIEGVRHAAAPTFHQLATAIMERAHHLDENTVRCRIHRALLLGEAFELLAGRNVPTAIAALAKLHAAEASLEAMAVGIFSPSLDLDPRRDEIENVLVSIYGSWENPQKALIRVHDFGLQIWSAITGAYRNFEAINAANEAQVESLVYVGRGPSAGNSSARKSWLAEIPLIALNFWMTLLSFRHLTRAIAERLPDFVRKNTPNSTYIGTSEQRLKNSLRRRRTAFTLFAKPWSFIALYVKFLMFWWFISFIMILVVNRLWVQAPAVIISKILRAFLDSFLMVMQSAMAGEIITKQDSTSYVAMDYGYIAIETGFVVTNFVFLTIMIAVIVRFILRD